MPPQMVGVLLLLLRIGPDADGLLRILQFQGKRKGQLLRRGRLGRGLTRRGRWRLPRRRKSYTPEEGQQKSEPPPSLP